MSHRAACLAVAALLALVAVCAAVSDCSGTNTNDNPVYIGEPAFVSKTTNGKRYLAGAGDDAIILIHVYGSPYEMGKAAGELFKPELKGMIDEFFAYLEEQAGDVIEKVPKEIRDFVAKWGLRAGLDLTYAATESYTPQHFKDELRGWADGSGVPERDLIRLNMLAEMIKAACSIVGAWGNSTSTSLGGSLVQLRALDWDANAPIKRLASVVVYHPTQGHAFANVGWPGMIGSITGFSNAPIGIAEKVWIHKNEKDLDSRFGTPWPYVLRDVLQFANELDDALTMLVNANRTCSIHVGVGDGNTGELRGVQYSAHQLDIFDDRNIFHSDAHPYLPGVVYWDKHVQPSGSPCLGTLLSQHYGELSPAVLIKYVVALHQTGDMQAAVFDFKNMHMYVANAAAAGESGPMNAYDRQFVRFDMTALFAETM